MTDKSDQNYDNDWGGAQVQPDLTHATVTALGLTGTLMRFALLYGVSTADREMRVDLFNQFNNAPPIELEPLSEKLSNDITHLQSLHVSDPLISRASI